MLPKGKHKEMSCIVTLPKDRRQIYEAQDMFCETRTSVLQQREMAAGDSKGIPAEYCYFLYIKPK